MDSICHILRNNPNSQDFWEFWCIRRQCVPSLVPDPSSTWSRKARKLKCEKRRRKGLGKWPTLWHSQGWNAAVGDNYIVACSQDCGVCMWPMNNVMRVQCATRGSVAQCLLAASHVLILIKRIRLSFNCTLA